MNLQNEFIKEFGNEEIFTDAETLEKQPRACVEHIQTKNGNLSDLPLMTEATIPEKIEPEKIQKLDLKYPTKHLNGFNELRTATRLHGNEYILIIKALWYGILSCLSSKIKLKLNQLETDGRMHLLIPVISGKGKGELKRVIKSAFKALGKTVSNSYGKSKNFRS